ncbi:hypothetical protein MBLNU459_g1411t1 [Dothideomycetes sp. NU459]
MWKKANVEGWINWGRNDNWWSGDDDTKWVRNTNSLFLLPINPANFTPQHQQTDTHDVCLAVPPPSPTIPRTQPSTTLPSTIPPELTLSSYSFGFSLHDSQITPQSPTTASHQQQPCLPQQGSPRQLPPHPAFHDFSLYGTPQAPSRPHRAHSHALKQRPTYNSALPSGSPATTSYSGIIHPKRHLPPVPPFSAPSQQSQTQNTITADSSLFTMVSNEPNFAYEGTRGDLNTGALDVSFNGGADMFFGGFDDPIMFGAEASNFTSVNSSTSSSVTVSPRDLLLQSMESAPSSTTMPALTPESAMFETPNTLMLETPGTSSEFGDTMSFDDAAHWPSLFPESAPEMKRNDSSSSLIVVHAGGERKLSSAADASPITANIRPSTVAGVRKKQKPLGPIVADPEDPVGLKRARNTAAARKSREKKLQQMDTLQALVDDLQAQLKQRDATIAQLNAQLGSQSQSSSFMDFSSLDESF